MKAAEQKQLTTRMALWSARRPLLTLLVWLVAVGALVGGGLIGLGIRSVSANDRGEARTDSAKASVVLHEAGVSQDAPLLVVVSHPTLKVSDPQFKATVVDIAARLQAATYISGGQTLPAFSQVMSYDTAPQLVALDQSSVQIIAPVSGDGDTVTKKVLAGRSAVQAGRAAHPGFAAYAFNQELASAEFLELLGSDLESSLKTTLPLTLIILLLAFGALAAALVPITLAMLTLVSTFSLLALYSHLVSAVDLSAVHIVVMIGLAVGIDYSLFIITRYRSERRRGRDKFAALEVASSTAGRAVFFSGLIVMVSLAGIISIPNPMFTTMALGSVMVVAISLLASLTFLPALLSVLGRGIDWGRIPYFGRERAEGSGVWVRLVRVVLRRPIVATLGVTIVLLALSTPLLHIRLGSASQNVDALPPSLEVRKAADLLQAKWPQGATLDLDLVVQADRAGRSEVQAATAQLEAAVAQQPGVGQAQVVTAPDGKVTLVRYTMSGDANTRSNWDTVRAIRDHLVPAAFKGISGAQVLVAGGAAEALDGTTEFTSVLPFVFGFVLGLSFLLLLVAFRSLVIPIKAILLNLLSAGATYGLIILIFQDGFLNGLLGVSANGVIASWLPLFLFAILFGLSMDYHLFVLTRIKEERDRGLSSTEAVALGIGATSGTVTSAAAIMVVVFAVFGSLQLLAVKEMGLALAIAVLIDATIIRSILLPASMHLLGEWNWWLPRWLGWLPHVSIEGSSEPVAEAGVEAEPAGVESEAGRMQPAPTDINPAAE